MKKVEGLFNVIVGLAIWMAIGYAIYYYFIMGEEAPKETEADFKIHLSDFKVMDLSVRHSLITAIAAKQSYPTEEIPNFIDCMGDFAANKSEDLIFEDVFQWCELEMQNNYERFSNHFNQLDAKDLSPIAVLLCRKRIENQLISPGTAKHPLLKRQSIDRGKWRYTIHTYVDSQNMYGALLRTRYNCTIHYNGSGEEYDPSNWTLDYFKIPS